MSKDPLKFYFSSQSGAQHAFEELHNLADEVRKRVQKPALTDEQALKALEQKSGLFTQDEYKAWSSKIKRDLMVPSDLKGKDFNALCKYDPKVNQCVYEARRFGEVHRFLQKLDKADSDNPIPDGKISYQGTVSEFIFKSNEVKDPQANRELKGTASVYLERDMPKINRDGNPVAISTLPIRFKDTSFTLAHRTLPLGTVVKVHYQGRVERAVVTDRGPFEKGRVADFSQALMMKLVNSTDKDKWCTLIHDVRLEVVMTPVDQKGPNPTALTVNGEKLHSKAKAPAHLAKIK